MPSTPDRIGAHSIGYLVRPWQARAGRVHSAYDRVVNLSLGTRLCTLAAASISDGPATIRVADADWSGLAGVSTGDPVALRAAWLKVGARVIDLRTARVWRPADPPDAVAAGALIRTAALRDEAIARGGASWIPALIGSVLSGGTVAGLLGRGSGLTPSGDDALVGAMAACWVLRRGDLGAAQAHARLALGVRERLDRTNDLSASFLEMAAGGHFQEPVWQAALALTGDAESAGPWRLLSIGATSGADCALGLTTALETLINRSNKVAA